jgi:hypothetical protein
MTVKVSANSFFRYLAAQSTTRVTKVREAKRMMEVPREDYRRVDYWAGIRDASVRLLLGSYNQKQFETEVGRTSDAKKVAHYQKAATGLQGWIGKKAIQAKPARSVAWVESGLEVSVTPELLVSWGDSSTYVLKLFFSTEPLSKFVVNPMLRIIEQTHGRLGVAAVLDIQRGKLHTGPTARPTDLDILLASEAASFVEIWNRLGSLR